MRAPLAAAIVVLLSALGPSAAGAVVPLLPAEKSFVGSTPTFTWQLAPGEQAFTLELSPNPATGDNGGFADDVEKRTGLLADTQTSYTIGSRQPLTPGTWFWHVGTFGADNDSRWSILRRIEVRDEPVRLTSFELMAFACGRAFNAQFTWIDNTADLPVTYRIEFRRRRGGRRVASIPGRGSEGRVFRTARLPRRVRRGKRYYVRLKLRDRGGHVARSRSLRFRAGRC